MFGKRPRAVLTSRFGSGLLLLFAATTRSTTAVDVDVDAVVVNLLVDVKVPAQEAGSLARIVSKEGSRVKAGDRLAEIDDQDVALEVTRAQIAREQAIDQAENDLKMRKALQMRRLAQLNLKNAEDSNKELANIVSESQLEKLRIEVENCELDIEQSKKDLAAAKRAVAAAENQLLIARRAVERRRVSAPIDGVVVEIRRRVGEWVQPGEAVVRIVQDDRLRAEGFVHVSQLGPDLVGQPAELLAAVPEMGPMVFLGTVTFVSPETNPINGQVRVWAEFDNSDGRLRPGTAIRLTVKAKSFDVKP